MIVEPYLSFEGRAEEAIEFYKKAIGAQVIMLMRFKDAPPSAGCGTENAEKVMHSALKIGETTVYASDGRCQSPAKFSGIALSLNVSDDVAAAKAFNALAEGGQITMPMAATFFASSFGMVMDKFGVAWMAIAEKKR
jgi:PhnB protein